MKDFIRKEFAAPIHVSEILDELCLAALSRKMVTRSGVLRNRSGDLLDELRSHGESARHVYPQSESANGVHYRSDEGKIPETLDFYLASSRPFLDDKEFRRTSQVVQIFQNGSGKPLQEKLESRQKAQNTGNSMSDLQSWGIYLRSR